MKSIRYKKIFILGSGFSKSVSQTMPTLKELTLELLQLDDNRNFNELTQFIKNLLKLAGQNEEVTTIEKITSIIISKGLFYNTEEKIFYNTLKHQLLRWIFERIEADSPIVDPDKTEKLIHFFEKNAGHSSDPGSGPALFLSFNYDLLLERLLSGQQGKSWTFDYIINLNTYLQQRHQGKEKESHHPVFEYLKLHGSLNWFTAPGADRNDLGNVYLIDENDPSKHLIHNRDIPVYIPMAFAKTEFFIGSLYNVLWNIGRRCLEEAEDIYFIGYGFPQTDIDNLYFFLNYKERIRDIVILEQKDSRKIRRLEKLFPDTRIYNQDAFDYLVKNHL
jgi:hypothetical protein